MTSEEDYHLGPDGEQYLTRKQAAKLMGITPKTIGTWEARGHLARLSGCPPRKPIYRLSDVIDAEYEARAAAVRTSGSDTRVVRRFDDRAAA